MKHTAGVGTFLNPFWEDIRMSTLVMLLAAGMAIPGNGPEKVSAEMEERLDLRGVWEGVYQRKGKSAPVRLLPAQELDRELGPLVQISCARGCVETFNLGTVTDEGNGRLKFHNGRFLLGIYKWDENLLFICCRDTDESRPTSVHGRDDQVLLILHRVKPGK
jgi:hypothetical protein